MNLFILFEAKAWTIRWYVMLKNINGGTIVDIVEREMWELWKPVKNRTDHHITIVWLELKLQYPDL